MSRYRTFDRTAMVTGTYWQQPVESQPPLVTTRSAEMGEWGNCTDTLGWPTPHALAIVKKNVQYPTLGGTLYTDYPPIRPYRKFNNFPLGAQLGPPAIPSASGIGQLSLAEINQFAWEVMSKANPSTPDINLLQMNAELKDIPSLMKNWYGLFLKGKHALTKAREPSWLHLRGTPEAPPPRWKKMLQLLPELIASGHLTWRWAIAPFIDDMRKLIDAAFLIKRKCAMLQRLMDGKALRRRVHLRTSMYATEPQGMYLHSEGALIYGYVVTQVVEKTWGTVSYSAPKPDTWPFFEVANRSDELLVRAKELTLGVTSYGLLETAWELMPWSWLVDWFTRFGDVIKATNNSLGLQRGAICLMQTIETRRVIRGIVEKPDWVTLNGSDFFQTSTTKDRVANAFPLLPFAPTYLPIFDWKAQSILGSLAVLRATPGSNPSSYLYRRTRS